MLDFSRKVAWELLQLLKTARHLAGNIHAGSKSLYERAGRFDLKAAMDVSL